MIRVLVAEDSATMRELLVAVLTSDPEMVVAGEAKNGLEAVEMAKRIRPDVVVMDIRMPVMDGLEATKRIMVEAPVPIVIVSGSFDVRDIEVSMNALRLGALTVLPKPPGPESTAFAEAVRQFVATVKAMSQVKVVRRWPERAVTSPEAARIPAAGAGRARVVAIAASTGGPAAMHRLFSGLPGDLPVPVLVVQHMAPGFVGGFAAWLNSVSPLRVKVADDGELLGPGVVYLAPDGHHLGVAGQAVVRLSSDSPLEGFRPSGTHLFRSVGASYGPSAIALILTGMGEDGVAGLRAVREAGGRVYAQDEASSVVFGMPRKAVEAGLVDAVLSPEDMAARVMEEVRQ